MIFVLLVLLIYIQKIALIVINQAKQVHGQKLQFQHYQLLIIQIYKTLAKPMPRLKKYSQIYNDDSGSFLALPPKTNQSQGKQQDQQQSGSNAQNIDNSNNKQSEQSGSESELQSESKSISNTNSNANLAKYSIKQNHKLSSENANKNKSTEKKKLGNKNEVNDMLRKIQQQCANNQDSETNVDLPDEVLVGYEEKKAKNKNKVKCKNKLFNIEIDTAMSNSNQINNIKNLSEEDELQLRRLQQEHRNFQNARNQKNAFLLEARKSTFENRVTKIRQRMEFKNAHQDIRYKEHIQNKLQDVKDCEQVQILLEAPKIFKGNSAKHTDGALYIKNLTQSPMIHTQSISQDNSISKEKEDKVLNKNKRIKNIDRKQFYQQFHKQVKQTRAVDLPVQANNLFKKTQLEELNAELQKNQHLFKQDTNSRLSIASIRSASNASTTSNKSQSKPQLERRSGGSNIHKPMSINRNESKISQFNLQERSRSESMPKKLISSQINKSKIQVVTEDQLNEESKQSKQLKDQKAKSQQLTDVNDKPKQQQKQQKQLIQNKQTKNKLKKSRELKNKNKEKKTKQQQKFDNKIKQFFQEQAEEQSNGYGDNGGCSSQQDDNEQLQQLIDRGEVKYVAKYEREAKKKYMQDQWKKDEQLLQKIKQRITKPRKIKCQQSSESRQRRKKRMNDARKRFEEEDGNNNGQFINDYEIAQAQSKQQYNNDFDKQLNLLEDEICKKEVSKIVQKNDKNDQPNVGIFTKNKHTMLVETKPKPNSQIKRGGFVNNSKLIIGPRIQNQKKGKSKQKDIKF